MNKELMEQVKKDWVEYKKTNGEMAALEIACQINGVTSDMFWGYFGLEDEK